jgi:restriction endonuclease Mrr
MITVRTFGNFKRMNIDFEKPEGCDHDQNVYHYRLVDGAMVFQGVALGQGWETRQMDWQGLSCYKQRGDMQMAKRQAPPYEELKQVFIDAEYKIDRVRKVLKVNWLDAKQWLKDAGLIDSYNRPTDKVTTSKSQALLESVDAGKPVRSMGCVEPELKPELQSKATEVAVEDNDWQDDEDDPIPYTITSPLDLAIESSFARARIKVDKLTKDPIALALIKDLIQAGVL